MVIFKLLSFGTGLAVVPHCSTDCYRPHVTQVSKTMKTKTKLKAGALFAYLRLKGETQGNIKG